MDAHVPQCARVGGVSGSEQARAARPPRAAEPLAAPVSRAKPPGGLVRVVNAFFNTLRGLSAAWRGEAAFRQEVLLVAALAGFIGWWGASAAQWVAFVAAGGAVLAFELVNTAIEAVCDRVTTERNELIRIAKDAGSAAVGVAIVVLMAVLAWIVAG
ncbi:diacylglycerol kinase [Derxia lacustris]|uniref:diacylglycerol kinase n=1 Tax=Derxia lacustris TaxID=764842 RepID=UPI000A16F32E|nr:diacylglycerol kinase [Derxia lacustris]